jgi:hypothetical protein
MLCLFLAREPAPARDVRRSAAVHTAGQSHWHRVQQPRYACPHHRYAAVQEELQTESYDTTLRACTAGLLTTWCLQEELHLLDAQALSGVVGNMTTTMAVHAVAGKSACTSLHPMTNGHCSVM